MAVALVTGAGGLVGSEACEYLIGQGFDVLGVDNDMRAYFFGSDASTQWRVEDLKKRFRRFRHVDEDIRDLDRMRKLMADLASDLTVVIHAAAQPSHDWAAREPFTDFSVNAMGTLNMLECVRNHAGDASFVFLSTNKVYGDAPNRLPLVEEASRWEIEATHPYFARGIDESMSIDQSTHSIFGASKVAADVLVQEYGRYFGMKTACFRGGCLTGSGHAGAELHGFLAYLMKCTATGAPYTVFGYKGKQVRDNIHVKDLVRALWYFVSDPKPGRVYNIGGGRYANCSMREAIDLCEEIAGRKLDWTYADKNRIGDHVWWISDISGFQRDYPEFRLEFDIRTTLAEILDVGRVRWGGRA